MSLNYIENFNNEVELFQSSKVARVIKRPLRMFLSHFLPAVAEKTGRPITTDVKMFWGGDMTVLLPEAVSVVIYKNGFFEKELTNYILKKVQPGMVFLDIGAHFGYFSLLASTIVGETGQVHSFEPTPSTFKVLGKNLQNVENSVVNNLAAWSSSTTVTLNDFGLKYASLNSLFKARMSAERAYNLEDKSYSVKTLSIDTYCEDNNISPDFVKIDAESAELEILIGMERVLQTGKPMITVEVGDEGDPEAGASRQLVDHLMKRGYVPHVHRGGKIVEHTPLPTYTYSNLLFIYKGK